MKLTIKKLMTYKTKHLISFNKEAKPINQKYQFILDHLRIY